MPSDLERAISFEEALRDRCAERIVPFGFGRALFNDSLPLVWDLNVLRVDEPAGATAEALVAEADRLQGEAGHRHRRLAVNDERAGDALADPFRSLGWCVDRFLVMGWRGGGERGADTAAAVEEVDTAALRPLREAIVGVEPWATSEDVTRMVVDATQLAGRQGNARHFAVRTNGEVASAADLYSDGRTAQVEDVATSAEFRGRGYATAVVLRAVEEALATGHDFVFLVADAEDWPKELYVRLGFAPLGHTWTFLKTPG
jgi:ribosomal protein S18 acetylase RimI-like enzyme